MAVIIIDMDEELFDETDHVVVDNEQPSTDKRMDESLLDLLIIDIYDLPEECQ